MVSKNIGKLRHKLKKSKILPELNWSWQNKPWYKCSGALSLGHEFSFESYYPPPKKKFLECQYGTQKIIPCIQAIINGSTILSLLRHKWLTYSDPFFIQIYDGSIKKNSYMGGFWRKDDFVYFTGNQLTMSTLIPNIALFYLTAW